MATPGLVPLANVGRGVLMGLAGLFPSVSAGTIALILGVHARLVASVASIDLRLPRDAWRAARGNIDAKQAVANRDLLFLLALVAGMALSIFGGVAGVDWLLANQPQALMALFVGLMAAGALLVWRRVEGSSLQQAGWGLLGVLAAVGLALLPPILSIGGAFGFVVAGFVAWSFMLLPGVSGSSMMVALGIYEPLIAAAKNLQWGALFAFGLGGAAGIALCSRLLQWLLEQRPRQTYALLAGLIAGSLVRVWPWRTEAGFANGLPTGPDWVANDLALLVAVLAGALIVRGLERLGPKTPANPVGDAAPDAK